MRLVILFSILFSMGAEARTTIKNPEKITPEMRQRLDLSSIMNRLRVGETREEKGFQVREMYRTKAMTNKCSFDLKYWEYHSKIDCKKTKEIKRKIRGKEVVKKVPDCKNKVEQKGNITIDLKKAKISKIPKEKGSKYGLAIDSRKFYFLREKHVSGLMQKMSQYQTQHCSK